MSDVAKDGRSVRYVDKVGYASIFAKKYGTVLCNGTGTVRWYAVSICVLNVLCATCGRQ